MESGRSHESQPCLIGDSPVGTTRQALGAGERHQKYITETGMPHTPSESLHPICPCAHPCSSAFDGSLFLATASCCLSLTFKLATPSYITLTAMPTRMCPPPPPDLLQLDLPKPQFLHKPFSGAHQQTPTGTYQRGHTVRHLLCPFRQCSLIASRDTGLVGLSPP